MWFGLRLQQHRSIRPPDSAKLRQNCNCTQWSVVGTDQLWFRDRVSDKKPYLPSSLTKICSTFFRSNVECSYRDCFSARKKNATWSKHIPKVLRFSGIISAHHPYNGIACLRTPKWLGRMLYRLAENGQYGEAFNLSRSITFEIYP